LPRLPSLRRRPHIAVSALAGPFDIRLTGNAAAVRLDAATLCIQSLDASFNAAMR
jgi:hypothetical protein